MENTPEQNNFSVEALLEQEQETLKALQTEGFSPKVIQALGLMSELAQKKQ
jgi:hypothetical protein